MAQRFYHNNTFIIMMTRVGAYVRVRVCSREASWRPLTLTRLILGNSHLFPEKKVLSIGRDGAEGYAHENSILSEKHSPQGVSKIVGGSGYVYARGETSSWLFIVQSGLCLYVRECTGPVDER